MKNRILSLMLTLALVLGLAPAVLAAPAQVAYPSTQKVDVDGKAVEFQCYALKDAEGSDTNYIKLRDLADILNGSAAQFQVGWDENVTITTGASYTPNGTEQKTPFSGQRAYTPATAQTIVDGVAMDLAAFILTDDDDGGYTYYKLRDLGSALGFLVDWSPERGIFIETDKTMPAAPAGDPLSLTSQSYSLPSGTVNAQVITVDMSDPRVSVRASVAEGKLNTTQTFADICAASGAVAVINANFFESYQTVKDPIGHVMVDGTFLYGSSGLASLGITADNEMRYGTPSLFFQVKTTDDGALQQWSGFEFNVLAQFANQSVVYTPARGASFPVTYPGAVLTVENGVTTGYQTVAKGDTVTIPANGFVLYSSTEVTSTTWYQTPEMGRQVVIEPYLFLEDAEGFSLDGVENMVSGGPRLVRDGAIVTTLEDTFAHDARFTTSVTSRTAVGTTADNKLLLVNVSAASIQQMRELMLALGCVDAFNLDGGGSTAMYYNGEVLSAPGRQLVTTLQVFVSE